jgi:hypothetical protein
MYISVYSSCSSSLLKFVAPKRWSRWLPKVAAQGNCSRLWLKVAAQGSKGSQPLTVNNEIDTQDKATNDYNDYTDYNDYNEYNANPTFL